jgi:hypothetical protein
LKAFHRALVSRDESRCIKCPAVVTLQ